MAHGDRVSEKAWNTDAARLPRDSRIALTRALPDEGEQVFIILPDGTGLMQVTHVDSGSNSSPAWSPDGARLCFASHQDGYSSLYTIKGDGSGRERLTCVEDADDDLPDWSPDGERIVFSRANRSGPDRLYLLHLPSGEERLLTEGPMDSDPCFSPDGRLIAFHRAMAQTPGIHVVAAEGGEPWFLLRGGEPSWAAQGRWLAYSHGEGIWVALVDEEARRVEMRARLTDDGDTSDRHPSWSPDGTHIAFERQPLPGSADVSQIVVMTRDGSEVTTLGEGRMPDWSPQPA